MNFSRVLGFILICTLVGCGQSSTVRVANTEGDPLKNTLVEIVDSKGKRHESTTDADGTANFKRIARGPYTVFLPQTPGWPAVNETKYEIQLLDTVKSIARDFKVLPTHILDAEANKTYFSEFPDPNVMMPGRSLTIPAQAQQSIEGKDKRTNITTEVIEPDFFRLDVKVPGLPDSSGIRVVFTAGDFTFESVLDASGLFEVQLPEELDHNAVLEFYYSVESEEPFFTQHTLLGAMLPYNTLGGAAARLSLLGWGVSINEDNTLGESSRSEVVRFQKEHNLNPTGDLDLDTMEKVKTLYGF